MFRHLILSSPAHLASSLLMIVVIWLILTIFVFVKCLVHFGNLIHYENENSLRFIRGMSYSRSHEYTIREAWQTTQYISTAIGITELLIFLILLLV